MASVRRCRAWFTTRFTLRLERVHSAMAQINTVRVIHSVLRIYHFTSDPSIARKRSSPPPFI